MKAKTIKVVECGKWWDAFIDEMSYYGTCENTKETYHGWIQMNL